MVDLTLLELHFHSDGDVQLGPRSLGRGLLPLGEDDDEESAPPGTTGAGAARPDGGEEPDRGFPLALVGLVLLVVAVAAAAVWRALGPE